MCTALCVCLVLIIVFYMLYQYSKKLSAEAQKKRLQVADLQSQILQLQKDFNSRLRDFFHGNHGVVNDLVAFLSDLNNKIILLNDSLKRISKADNMDLTVNTCRDILNVLIELRGNIASFPNVQMIDEKSYGKINSNYMDAISLLNKEDINRKLDLYNVILNVNSLPECEKLLDIDLDFLVKSIWFFALEKPFSMKSFQKVTDIFNRTYRYLYIEEYTAELYALKQVGGNDALRTRVKEILNYKWNAYDLTQIASNLMWMGAYEAENIVLQSMLNNKMEMSPKAQERLHALATNGGKSPQSLNIEITNKSLYFDVNALAWKEQEYEGLFENLSFQDAKLSYGLAIRDDNKNLMVSKDIDISNESRILERIKVVFEEEYDKTVSAEAIECVAISGNVEEKLNCIVAKTDEVRYLMILMHIARIGKRLNIKFYTLFMPMEDDITLQKQQVISLKNKLSPTVTNWEESLKENMLLAIQQILNTSISSESNPKEIDSSSNEPMF